MEEKSTGICLFRQYQNYFRTSPAKNVPGRVLSIITKLAVLFNKQRYEPAASTKRKRSACEDLQRRAGNWRPNYLTYTR